MAGTLKRIGPLALTTSLTTNVYNNTSALIFDSIKQINVANKTGTAATFTLYLGATGANAAGTEIFTAVSVPANTTSSFYFNPGLKMTSTDFLVGGAGTTTALVITILTEQTVV
jgi:hypothetical protein